MKSSASCSFRIRPAIVLFGDSITQFGFGVKGQDVGWAGLLAAAYTRRADVLNRGFSGYNTDHAVELLPRVFTGPLLPPTDDDDVRGDGGVLFCTVFFGANDAALPGHPQHVPIEKYTANVASIVTSIRKRMQTRNREGSDSKLFPILLLTPPPVYEVAWAEWREIERSDRANDVTREYGLMLRQVAAQHEGCEVVDSWELLEGDSVNRKNHLSDGLHLNESGNRLIFRGIMDVLVEKFPQLLPMDDDDGDGEHGKSGIPIEEAVWKDLCGWEE